MISLIIYELAVILLYLALRALRPELFVVGGHKLDAAVQGKRKLGARTRSTTSHFICHRQNYDPAHGAGMGMMIH